MRSGWMAILTVLSDTSSGRLVAYINSDRAIAGAMTQKTMA